MLENEALITFGEAGKRCYPAPKSYSAVYHDAKVGVRCRNGQIIRLEYVRSGHKHYTSAQAVQRFIRRQTEADQAHHANKPRRPAAPAKPRSAKQRERQIARARRNCEAAGIG